MKSPFCIHGTDMEFPSKQSVDKVFIQAVMMYFKTFFSNFDKGLVNTS